MGGCKPRPISGNQPFDAIAKDYNRYCDRIVGNGGGLFFNPGDLSPLAWYDFSDTSLLFTDAGITPVSSDGDLIFQANDKSDNGINLTQSTIAIRPLYKIGIQNGLSVSRFDGVDDYIDNAVFALAQPSTIYVVFKLTDVDVSTIFDSVKTAVASAFFGGAATTMDLYAGGAGTFSEVSRTTNFSIYRAIFNSTSSSITKNGGTPTTGTVDINGFDGIRFMSSRGVLGNPATGDLCESIIFSGLLSSDNDANIVNYLNNKWGIF